MDTAMRVTRANLLWVDKSLYLILGVVCRSSSDEESFIALAWLV